MAIQSQHDLANLRERIRHSATHVMADVVTTMFPDAKLAIGPPTEDGFYYDFMIDSPFTSEDLEEIERRMRVVISEDHAFEYAEYPREQMNEMNADEPLKLEVIAEIPEGEPISTYTHRDFEDLCAGPHVESTGRIPAFKLLSVAGAYWRGDESRPMLQRIYGTAFESQEALDEHLGRLEQARLRDHRTVGRDLDLFSVHDETGPGLIIWHPKGARVRGLVEDLWEERALPLGIRPRLYAPHRTLHAVGDQRPPGELQGEHVRRHGHGGSGLLPQADELPVPHHVLSQRPAQLPRPADANWRARLGLSLRARRHPPRYAPGEGNDPGRRPHLLPPRPDRKRGERRSRPHVPPAGHVRLRGLLGHAFRQRPGQGRRLRGRVGGRHRLAQIDSRRARHGLRGRRRAGERSTAPR